VTRRARPPRRVERLLARALARAVYRDDILGDLHEAFADLHDTRGAAAARLWYTGQAIRLALRYGARAPGAARSRHDSTIRGGTGMDRLMMDVRLAVRSLVKRPLMSLAVVLTLALGIGANAAVFGVVDALVLHPYAMHDVDRIVMPVTTSPQWIGRRETVSRADFLDWRRELENGAIDHLAATLWWDANLVGRDEPERVLGFFVSPAFFDALDAHAAIGRTLGRDEEVPANAKRIVLSDGLWRRRFGADPAIVGRPVRADGDLWIVVGVMPPGFDFPMGAELWAPLALDQQAARNRTTHDLTVYGRLAPGRTLGEAQAQMGAIAQRLAREHPDTNAQLGAAVYTVSRGMSDVGVPQILALWQAAGLIVLLIACANIANLLLARGAEREREIAIRLALGSSRSRIIRESLVESALLVVAAIPLALAVASVSLRLMHAFMPARIVHFIAGWNRLGVDRWTVGATIACAAAAAAIFGTLPAWQMARGIVGDALKSDGRTGAGPRRQRLRRALVVAEIALALPLLVAATLSVSTVTRSLGGWQGYDPTNVLTVRAALPERRYPDADSRARFVTAALDAIARTPGVRDQAAANTLPAIDSNATTMIELPGRPVVERSKAPRVDFRAVSPRLFDVLRIPVVSGRAFTTGDQKSSEAVAIVSESMARKFWPSGDAIGERVRIVNGPWMRIVGVCGDVVHDWFDYSRWADNGNGRVPTLYRPIAQAPSDTLVLAVRAAGDPLEMVSGVRAAIARADPMQPVYEMMTLRQVLRDRTISLQYIASVMTAFAALALLLALLGLYAVMTVLVTQRVREIGVRIALGATARDVARLTLSEAGRLTAIGIAVGLVLAVAFRRGMEAGLLGLASSDIRATAALAAALAAASIAASYLPARRAASVDPIVALRTE